MNVGVTTVSETFFLVSFEVEPQHSLGSSGSCRGFGEVPSRPKFLHPYSRIALVYQSFFTRTKED